MHISPRASLLLNTKLENQEATDVPKQTQGHIKAMLRMEKQKG